jgi:CubicO group peptidase (beta-lactamase class C family)
MAVSGTVLAHQAGLPLLEAQLSQAEVLEWHPVVTALAAQSPLWQPGAGHAYHAFTMRLLRWYGAPRLVGGADRSGSR